MNALIQAMAGQRASPPGLDARLTTLQHRAFRGEL